MKLTVTQLKQLIKEELLSEGLLDMFKPKMSPLNKELKAFLELDARAKRIFNVFMQDPNVAEYANKGDYDSAIKMARRADAPGVSDEDRSNFFKVCSKIWQDFR